MLNMFHSKLKKRYNIVATFIFTQKRLKKPAFKENIASTLIC